MLAEALGHPLGRREQGFAPPLWLGLVERLAEAHGDHRVLERDPLARVHVDVAGGDRGHLSRSASSASSRFRRRSWRQKGRWSSMRKRSGPKIRARRRATTAACRPASTREATAPRRAQPERQTSPAACGSSASSEAGLAVERVLAAAASVQPRAQRRVGQCEAVSARQRFV